MLKDTNTTHECVYGIDGRCYANAKDGRKPPSSCSKKCKDYVPYNTYGKVAESKFAGRNYYVAAFKLMSRMLSGIFSVESSIAGERKTKEQKRRGHYHFIPQDIRTVVPQLFAAWHLFNYLNPYRDRPIKFLDCGAGVGNVVMMADCVGFEAYGIEYNPETVRRGRALMKKFGFANPKKMLLQDDLLEFNDYDKFDILYLYCPMSDTDKERKFEYRLLEKMRKGAILLGGWEIRFNNITNKPIFIQRARIALPGALIYPVPVMIKVG